MSPVSRLWTCSYKLLKLIQNWLNQWISCSRVRVRRIHIPTRISRLWHWRRNIGDDTSLNCIRPMPSIHLCVVRCALSQQKENDDWRWTTLFQIFTRIRGRSCKVIMNSESCINEVSTVITKFVLEVVPYPHTYRVTWINSYELEIKQRCLVPINFVL